MGKNTLEKSAEYMIMKKNNFPLEMTTNQMEGAIPKFTKYAGYDKEISTIFRNIGAPRFQFDDNKMMTITFSMEVDLYDEFFDNKLASLQFYDIVIECEMWLDGMNLDFKWLNI